MLTNLYVSDDSAVLAMATRLPLVQIVKATQSAAHVLQCKQVDQKWLTLQVWTSQWTTAQHI